MDYNNDAKGIVEFPLTPKELDILRDIYSNFIVELEAQDASKDKAFNALIKITQRVNKKISPRWAFKKLVEIDEFQVVENEGIIHFVFDEDSEEGGENMETEEVTKVEEVVEIDYSNKMTSGEEKVAKAALDHFKEAFKIGRTPSRMSFESCLQTAFPKIKNGKAATNKMIKGGYIVEKDGKILLGEEGKDYLSL